MIAPVLLPILLLARLAVPGPEFVRIAHDGDRRHLQTRVADYVHPSGVRVTLVATVHLAEPAYFASIRQRLEQADAVVHEGVQRRQIRRLVRPYAPPTGLVAQTQVLWTNGPRFVRGDLDEEAFERARDARVAVASVPDDRGSLARAVLHSTTDLAARRAADAAFAIPARNAAAITALKHRLARGDRHIHLLYGASHAPDLDRRLIDDLGFTRSGSTWLEAFSF